MLSYYLNNIIKFLNLEVNLYTLSFEDLISTVKSHISIQQKELLDISLSEQVGLIGLEYFDTMNKRETKIDLYKENFYFGVNPTQLSNSLIYYIRGEKIEQNKDLFEIIKPYGNKDVVKLFLLTILLNELEYYLFSSVLASLLYTHFMFNE